MGESSSKFENEKMAMTEESEGSDKENNIIKMEVTDGISDIPPMRDDSDTDDNLKSCSNDSLCDHSVESSKPCSNDSSFEHSGESSEPCKNDSSCENSSESSKPCTDDSSCEHSSESSKPCTDDSSYEHSSESSKPCTDDSSCEYSTECSKPHTDGIQEQNNNNTNSVLSSERDDSEKCTDDTEMCTYDTETCTNETGSCANDNVDLNKDDVSDCTSNNAQIQDSLEFDNGTKEQINNECLEIQSDGQSKINGSSEHSVCEQKVSEEISDNSEQAICEQKVTEQVHDSSEHAVCEQEVFEQVNGSLEHATCGQKVTEQVNGSSEYAVCEQEVSEQVHDSSEHAVCEQEVSEQVNGSSEYAVCEQEVSEQVHDSSEHAVCEQEVFEQVNGSSEHAVCEQEVSEQVNGRSEYAVCEQEVSEQVHDSSEHAVCEQEVSEQVHDSSEHAVCEQEVSEQVHDSSVNGIKDQQIDEKFINGVKQTDGGSENSADDKKLQIDDIPEKTIESTELQKDDNLEKTVSSQQNTDDSLTITISDESTQLHTNDSSGDSTDCELKINDSSNASSKAASVCIDDKLDVCENVEQLQSDDSSEICLNELHIDENCDTVTMETKSDSCTNSIQAEHDNSSDLGKNKAAIQANEDTKLLVDEKTELQVVDNSNLCCKDTQLHVDDKFEACAEVTKLDINDNGSRLADDRSRECGTMTYTEQGSQTDEIFELSKELATQTGTKEPPIHQDNIKEIQLQKEVTSLKEQLGQSKMLVKKFQSALLVQQVQSNHVITGLKQQLQRNQDEMKKQRLKYDRQLGEVISHMLFLEGQLKKSKKQINLVLKEKDDVILQQKNQISTLTSTNDKLLQAVRDMYGRKQGKNGVVLDEKHAVEEEPLSSPTVKEKEKFKTPDKSRFSSLKDKLRRHRSSLDLSEADINVKSGFMNSRQYSSQENLLSIGKRNREARAIRDKKCRSIAGYPDGTLADLILEDPDETECRTGNESIENIGPDFEHWKQKYLNTSNSSETVSQTGSTGGIFTNGHSSSDFDERSTGSLSGSMPILSERDTNANLSPPKERPHSVSSFEHLHVHDDHSPSDKSPGSSPTNTSNPFKNLKTILKRKGSKMKSNKKRTVSMSQPPAQPYHQDSMKKHFEKYDMS